MKQKAAERFHGRRGGGYTGVDRRDLLLELARLRLSAVARGTWPEHSLREWRERAKNGDPHALEVVAAEKVALERKERRR